jgi:hypothetical protein
MNNNELLQRVKDLEDYNKILTEAITTVLVELGLTDKITDHIYHFSHGYKLYFKPRIEKIEKILEVNKYKETFTKENKNERTIN